VNSEILSKLRGFAEAVARREGCALYDLEWVGQGKGRILRVYIDKLEGTSHVSIQDCSNVSKGLNLLLDVENLIPGGSYHLEVSSPGLERSLKSASHFAAAVGEKVRLHLRRRLGDLVEVVGGLEAARRLEATILACEQDLLRVVINGGEFAIPLVEIEKAKVIFDFEKVGHPKEKRK
jgi:ribosome maturation factor RimP